MSNMKRITVVIFAVLLLAANLPLCVSAVDPVSAATMANAFAQAVAAYGASQGVSMSFDVADTNGIGEGIHDLWNQFADDANQDSQSGVVIPYADSAAVSLWNTTFTKIGDKLGIDLQAETVSMFDGFWNWLLSGPAEMSKVDNQYYEWNQVDGQSVPIVVLSTAPFPTVTDVAPGLAIGNTTTGYRPTYLLRYTSGVDAYVFTYDENGEYYPIVVCNSSISGATKIYNTNGALWSTWNWQLRESVSSIYFYNTGYTVKSGFASGIPVYSTYNDGKSAIIQYIGYPVNDDISIKPYPGIDDPGKVYIPDNDDVNYSPIPASIPLNISWDDSLYGDGTGSLTDAQAEAAAQAIDDAITSNPDKAIELAETADPPIPGTEVYIPFLPVELPNFNFNLSGIWHYVREWIASLGAWFSTVMTVWASLPYAMVVPVYASLVVVIVLGVYKRFFM